MKLNLKFNDARDVWSTRAFGMLFVLDRSHKSMGTEAETEYMIVARLGKHPNGYVIRPVDPSKHELVEHGGFECSGSMCRTTAYVKNTGARTGMGVGRCITPGLVSRIVHVTENMNYNWSFPVWDQAELDRIQADPDYNPDNWKPRSPDEGAKMLGYYKWGIRPLRPNKCYVERGDSRACGLYDITGLGRGI